MLQNLCARFTGSSAAKVLRRASEPTVSGLLSLARPLHRRQAGAFQFRVAHAFSCHRMTGVLELRRSRPFRSFEVPINFRINSRQKRDRRRSSPPKMAIFEKIARTLFRERLPIPIRIRKLQLRQSPEALRRGGGRHQKTRTAVYSRDARRSVIGRGSALPRVQIGANPHFPCGG
jgi:hypothetical protein